MDKEQVAETLNKIATLLELKGENPFKARAYNNAARQVESLSGSLESLVAENRLGEINGIGDALQKKIAELVTTGKLQYYEDLRDSTPPGLLLLLEIPGLGPKKTKALHDQLGIATIEQLEAACRQGKVATLPGFGNKTQANICRGIERRRSYASRHLISKVLPQAEELLDALRAHQVVIRCAAAGSLRRHRELIGDIDLLASSKTPGVLIDFFCSLPQVERVLARGDTRSSVLLPGGVQADLRVVHDSEFTAALLYSTGSKEHNIVLRQRAVERGLRLNEYGLFRSKVETRNPSLRENCRTEHELYQMLGLHFIPPEMREDRGEFAMAEAAPIPRLLEWTDLKGSLHNHSTWSDGHQHPEEIARCMRELGLSYWAITDHSKSSVQANGLDPGRLRQQLKAITQVNAGLEAEGSDFRLLTGIEVDIHRDGQLDLPNEILRELDVVIASIHQSLSLPEAENTRRLIAAAHNPFVHILGHVSGRRLLEREPYPLNHGAVIDACAATGTFIELNASPRRFDMDWRFWPYARQKGVKCAINCDAHRLEQAGYLRLGAGIARKAGLTRDDVLNTLPLPRLLQALAAKRNPH